METAARFRGPRRRVPRPRPRPHLLPHHVLVPVLRPRPGWPPVAGTGLVAAAARGAGVRVSGRGRCGGVRGGGRGGGGLLAVMTRIAPSLLPPPRPSWRPAGPRTRLCPPRSASTSWEVGGAWLVVVFSFF